MPLGTINPKGTQTFMKIMRDLEDGNTKFAWVNVEQLVGKILRNANHWLKAAERWIISLLQVKLVR